jgi:hypothetical protein
MAEGFAFLALGRALPREPDLVRRVQPDGASRSLCAHRDRCWPTLSRGARSVLVHAETAPVSVEAGAVRGKVTQAVG